MPEHVYDREELTRRFDAILGRTLEEIDSVGLFDHVQGFALQKGVVGTLVERCVLGYAPDSKQEADLVVTQGGGQTRVELKSTGMVVEEKPTPHFVAKEPMSITAVGIYDLADQVFETSHFWNKLEHMLLVYYHYESDHPVTPYEYRNFPIKGYEFHAFDADETAALRQDWEEVRALAREIVRRHPGERDKAWKAAVREDYIRTHGGLRRVLSYIDLAPKFPPRFRLKKPVVSAMIARHFGYRLEQLPGRYAAISDVDRKCRELTRLHAGKTMGQLARDFGLPVVTASGRENKAMAEQLVVAMFGGRGTKLNQIEMFQRFGLIAKSVAVTPKGGRTEDMKLFHMDFQELSRAQILDDDGSVRPFQFEDSQLYSYFADHGLLCVLFREPAKARAGEKRPLAQNTFLGFKRLVFGDGFIDGPVRRLWEDTREKVLEGTLEDVIQRRGDGSVVRIGSGEVSSAPNFLKSGENPVFLRGSGVDSSAQHKTERVNGIAMLPQYVWLKGSALVEELREAPEL